MRPKMRQNSPIVSVDGTVLHTPEYSAYHAGKKPVTTWLQDADYALFYSIAQSHGVTAATYLRAVIADVLAEEGPKVKTVFTLSQDEPKVAVG